MKSYKGTREAFAAALMELAEKDPRVVNCFTSVRCCLPPFILGFILCETIEANFRRGIQLADGNFVEFLKSPIAAVFLVLTVLSVVLNVIRTLKKTTKKEGSAE